MKVNIEQTASFLKESDHILILSHQSPDGDTMGAAFALFYALKQIGKKVRMECADGFPQRFCLTPLPAFEAFEPQTVVAVDVADTALLGDKLQQYAACVDLCIDHHPTNTKYAKRLLLSESAAATCEVIFHLLPLLGVRMTKELASYLYMGISTDTGCFIFSNTTPQTHRIAEALMAAGADYIPINVRFFETKSKSRIMIERQALDSIRFFFQERCALIVISRQMILETHAEDSELDGVSAIPRQIEGVEIGITLREKENNKYKVSMRSGETIDVSKICGMLGGGGHMRASGCVAEGSCEEAIAKVVKAVADFTGWNEELS